MSLVIPLTPKEETQLSVVARKHGLAPAEFVKKIVAEYLPTESIDATQTLDAKLREWQKQDNTVLMPEIPSETLFAQWAAEDEQMTDKERADAEKLWAEIETALLEKSPVLALRRL